MSSQPQPPPAAHAELVERDVLENSALAELEKRARQIEACDQLLARLRRRVVETKVVETRDAGVGPDEPYHHDERAHGALSPEFNYVYAKGTAKGYLLGATAGSKGAHTGPVITDADAFWEAYCGLDGRRKGSVEYNEKTARKAIENLFVLGKGRGKRGGQKDRRQGKDEAVNYGGQGRGKGGHEKGGQGKGQIAAAQWTTSAVGDDVGLKDVPLAERWGERKDLD